MAKFSVASIHRQRARKLPYVVTILDEFGWPAIYFPQSQIRAAIYDWCEEHCQHHWTMDLHNLLFEHEDDAILFKLSHHTK